MSDLFDAAAIRDGPDYEGIAEGAVLLRGFALPSAADLLGAIERVAARAPFRRMTTPWGAVMSVAMTNCGDAGWITDRKGYRYDRVDPETGLAWPDMPECFLALAEGAAKAAGYPGFVPDACLINRYEPGTRLSLHQDKDERDYGHPIVSVSLGLPAIFQFGGLKRSAPVRKLSVRHGDVAVWGGPARLVYHGVGDLADGAYPALGRVRINLTLRRAL
jgi:alkylated DNA repair protein (DNA oxidative demethylase)